MSDGPTTPDSHVMTAPRPSTQRIGLLVLGMHRSGTSALTRLLSLLGAGLPKTLLGGDSTNIAGHWEPKPIMDYHDRMLAELGSRWDDWRTLDLDQLPESRRRELKDDLGQLVDEEFGSSELFVLKDPRVCRFVSLYRDVLSDKGIEPRYVIALRNPLAVVASLRQRNGMTDGFASLLWLRHVLDAEVATRDSPRAIATYESILADWRPALGTIGAKLALKWPRPLSSADDDVNAFLKRELQHYAPSRRELFARRDISSWVKDTYRALLALEQNADDEEAMQALDRVRTEFEAAAPVFGAAMFPELAARDARAAEAHRTEVVGLQASLRLRDSDIIGLRTEIAGRDEQIGGLKTAAAELRSQTAARDEQIGRLSAAAAEVHKLRDEQSVLQRTLEANERELAAVRGELERSREEETLLRTTLQTSERELAAVRRELGESLSARETLQREHDARVAEAASACEQLKQAEARLNERFEEIATLTKLVRDSEHAARRTADELEWIRKVAAVLIGDSPRGRLVWLLPGPLAHVLRQVQLKRRGLFDADAYSQANPDVARTGSDPLRHYILHGLTEGRWRG